MRNSRLKARGRKSLLATVLLLAFTAIFSVGCGSSNDGFVATNGGFVQPAPASGDLVFDFVQAQAGTVPAGTTDLDFTFFDSNGATVFFDSQPFANQIIVRNVPNTAVSVVVTARNGNTVLGTLTGNFTVVVEDETVVPLGGFTPAPEPEPTARLVVEPESLQFAPGGLIGTLDDVASLILDQQALDNIAFFRTYFIDAQGNRIEVTSRTGVSFSNFSPATVTADSFSHLNLLGTSIGVTRNPFGPTPPFGTTATMTVTYIEDGVTYTDDVQITLENPVLQQIDVLTAPGGTLTLPNDNVTGFPVFAVAVFSNGVRLPIDLENGSILGGFPGYSQTFEMTETTNLAGLSVVNVDVDSDGGTTGNNAINVSGGTGGTSGAITVAQTNAPAGTTPVSTTFNVNLVAGDVSEVALVVPRTNIDPQASYSVVVTYDDAANSTQDITANWFQLEGSGDGFVVFSGIEGFLTAPTGRLVGVGLGDANIFIDQGAGGQTGVDNVTNFLNGAVGLPGSDTSDANNDEDITVVNLVPGISTGELVIEAIIAILNII